MIIGIAGKKQSGKDTVAKAIIKMMPEFKRIAFADQMKDCLAPFCELLGWTRESLDGTGAVKEYVDGRHGFSRRQVMQMFGTEFGRALNKDLWVNLLEEKVSTGLYVMPDVRFDNEAELCRRYGFIINVNRHLDTASEHVSEDCIHTSVHDYFVKNDSDFLNLWRSVKLIMKAEFGYRETNG